MGVNFEDDALTELMDWMQDSRKTADKIHTLIKDIRRNGAMSGIGKPERLKYKDAWSRRIDKENRLVYNVDEHGNVHIFSCRGHYED
ncbi:MAG: Txe/YoeB family addiction module toxin [Selenomonadaceae bacterium]|nr:Txe/YoeB family addiction module toxin [Selenomonadaceae bacterium]